MFWFGLGGPGPGPDPFGSGLGGPGPGPDPFGLALGGPGPGPGPAYTINKLDSDNKVNIMVVYTKKYFSQKKFCREGANLRGSVHQKKVLFPKRVLPRRCQSKRLI